MNNIQGAIAPLALRKETTPSFDDDPPPHQEDGVSGAVRDSTVLNNSIALTKTLNFRDGEHSGAAPLEEIMEGFDDGELTEQCQIFDEAMDEWVDITEFLEKSGFPQSRETNEGAESLGSSGFQNDGTNSAEAIVDFDLDELPLIDKNDKKKPARNSAAWGKGETQPVLPVGTGDNREDGPVENGMSGIDYRTRKVGHVKPPAKLLRLVTQAMIQWDMLQDGDRLLLGLSGGKDSLSLLHILLHFQRKLPIRFDIEVCTIDPMTPSFGKSLTKECLCH